MEFFANELSFCEQFHEFNSFRDAFIQLMRMRKVAHSYSKTVYFRQGFSTLNPIKGVSMKSALNRVLSKEELRSAMAWLDKNGPFWDDLRKHDSDDYMEFCNNIVTDSSVGEAAYRKMRSIDSGLVSAIYSTWEFTPITVIWSDGVKYKSIDLENYWDTTDFENCLRKTEKPIKSWQQLKTISINRFQNLYFAKNSFEPLLIRNFATSTARQILRLLDILNKFAHSFDEDGSRSRAGHEIYQNFFTGEDALFSDSSDTEKSNFADQLRFPHPEIPGKFLDCTWHGKERHSTIRIHFSWPVVHGEPIYITYIGRKLTTR